MLLALLLFVGYLRVLYYIFFQSKDKLPVWRVALFLLSCIPLFSSVYFLIKRLRYYSFINISCIYKFFYNIFIIFRICGLENSRE